MNNLRGAALLLSIVVGACAGASLEDLEEQAAASSGRCGNLVWRVGPVTVVLPNGVDDTASLQCAFDLAVASGRATLIKLLPGTYHTRQVVVTGFRGRLAGSGRALTTVRNTAAPASVDSAAPG